MASVWHLRRRTSFQGKATKFVAYCHCTILRIVCVYLLHPSSTSLLLRYDMSPKEMWSSGIIFKPVKSGRLMISTRILDGCILRCLFSSRLCREAVLLFSVALIWIVDGVLSTVLALSHIYQTWTHKPFKPFLTLFDTSFGLAAFHHLSKLPVHEVSEVVWELKNTPTKPHRRYKYQLQRIPRCWESPVVCEV